jgi:hypothetical protein
MYPASSRLGPPPPLRTYTPGPGALFTPWRPRPPGFTRTTPSAGCLVRRVFSPPTLLLLTETLGPPLRDLSSSFYSDGHRIPLGDLAILSLSGSLMHCAPPCAAVLMRNTFPKLISSRSVIPRLYCLFATCTSLQLGRSAPYRNARFHPLPRVPHRGRPVLPQPSYAPFVTHAFPKLIDPRSGIPCFLCLRRASLPPG